MNALQAGALTLLQEMPDGDTLDDLIPGMDCTFDFTCPWCGKTFEAEVWDIQDYRDHEKWGCGCVPYDLAEHAYDELGIQKGPLHATGERTKWDDEKRKWVYQLSVNGQAVRLLIHHENCEQMDLFLEKGASR